MQKSVALAALAATLVVPSSGTPPARVFSAAALADSADSVERMRVLWIGAHPDDEDTNIIAWLARGRGVETAYLSLTRGDGGHNLIGNELGEALGVIRTEELLAARRIDGAHQYFGGDSGETGVRSGCGYGAVSGERVRKAVDSAQVLSFGSFFSPGPHDCKQRRG